MQPHISVIIPAHNSEKTIAEAIDSILAQTYKNLEIIIVDDNSSDSTHNVVENYIKQYANIHYYKLPFDDPHRVNKRGRNINAGYMARNYAIDKIKGEWVTFQDADDISLNNRIEVQYYLAQKYSANHVCVDWQQYNESYKNASLDVDRIYKNEKNLAISKEEIYALSQKTKGIFIKIFGKYITSLVPFEIKRLRIINRLFFGSLEQYPGTGNSPLFKREIFDKIQFQPLAKRIWPSFAGRGADRDFNFRVAETFKSSMTFRLPLYLWRVDHQNEPYKDYEKYMKK